MALQQRDHLSDVKQEIRFNVEMALNFLKIANEFAEDYELADLSINLKETIIDIRMTFDVD